MPGAHRYRKYYQGTTKDGIEILLVVGKVSSHGAGSEREGERKLQSQETSIAAACPCAIGVSRRDPGTHHVLHRYNNKTEILREREREGERTMAGRRSLLDFLGSLESFEQFYSLT